MKLLGSAVQSVQHYLYDASGSITTGGTAQLILGRSQSRSYLYIGNTSAGPLTIEFGAGRATATVSSGKVTAITVTNAGFGFTRPPIVECLGGGYPPLGTFVPGGGGGYNSSYTGLSQPNAESPRHPCVAHAVMTGSAPNQTIASITVDDGGAAYALAPYVFLRNSDLDPNGCSIPSATVGIVIPSGGQKEWNGTMCPTEPIGIFGATTAQAFVCKWSE